MKELREIYRSNSFKQGNMGRLSFDVASRYCSLYQFVGHKPSVCPPWYDTIEEFNMDSKAEYSA